MLLRRGIMKNLGIFAFKPWPNSFFHPALSCLISHLPFCHLSLSAYPPTPPLHLPLGCLRTANGLLRTTGFFFLYATYGYMIYMWLLCQFHVLSMSIKKIYWMLCLTLYYLNGRIHGFYRHSSGCLIPCKQNFLPLVPKKLIFLLLEASPIFYYTG